jgi:pimeloyl-ACP methyl ester carboxylesterase
MLPSADVTQNPCCNRPAKIRFENAIGDKNMVSPASAIKSLDRLTCALFSRIIFSLLIIFFISSGCVLVQLKKEVKQVQASTILVGHIAANFSGNGPIVVVACIMDRGKWKVAHYSVLHDSGEFELMVPGGDYYLFAYRDKNSNLIYDAGEPAGQYGSPDLVSAPAGGVVGGFNFEIREKSRPIGIPYGFEISSDKPIKLYSRLAGAKVDLDEALFSEENGSKGFWEPVSFYRSFGGNIYFLEDYDPQKIPILFIHGATGTPRGWDFFVHHIDRTRFQPWFFYYPSGARIQSMSHLLYWKLLNLKLKYNFQQLYITAHSMGGLIGRSFIVDYGRYFPSIKLFVTLATPWGGDRMAEYGVRQSPAVVPCWIDMQPESAFMQSLYKTRMPRDVSFYMFYGYRGSRNPFRSNNDGTISLSSLLDRRPQSEAKMNYAFNEDHETIISSREVLEQYNTIINNFAQGKDTAFKRSGGYLNIRVSYDTPGPGGEPLHGLILQPAGNKHAATVTYVSADENGVTTGPFPPGDYLASLLDSVGKPGDRFVPVTIKSNGTSELNFTIVPDAVIMGYVTNAVKPEGWAAGMPNERVTMHSITLKGAGTHRRLHILEGEDVNLAEHMIRRIDYYYNGYFVFYGLPEGDCELTVRAKGYRPFVMKCFARADITTDPVFAELTPEE